MRLVSLGKWLTGNGLPAQPGSHVKAKQLTWSPAIPALEKQKTRDPRENQLASLARIGEHWVQ